MAYVNQFKKAEGRIFNRMQLCFGYFLMIGFMIQIQRLKRLVQSVNIDGIQVFQCRVLGQT